MVSDGKRKPNQGAFGILTVRPVAHLEPDPLGPQVCGGFGTAHP